MANKEKILAVARKRLVSAIVGIKKGIGLTKKNLEISSNRFKSLSYADQMVERIVIANNKKRINELEHLKSSPYFVRCDVVFQGEEKEDTIYFGKFSFDEEDIYSWVTPASAIRFEKPGEVFYRRPDGMKQKIKLLRKDQFMIVGGEIKFLSSEALNTPRELIYEEYFSARKTGFVLPEIVAEMEKAQDQVIRAHHIGPFLISGPAGSGKTTLALHRVAYLIQSPDLAELYSSKSTAVFVQDDGTKEYFSHLLPELGIDDVEIMTFAKWAFSILDIGGNYVDRYGDGEREKDLYEFQKLKALRNLAKQNYSEKNPFQILEKFYVKYFNSKQLTLFYRQKESQLYDRIDLTILLKNLFQHNGELSIKRDYYVTQRNGFAKKKNGRVALEYPLIVVDEFQNYLPDQLHLMKTCLDKKSRSIVYVGDMAQQVRLGTIRDWKEIAEEMEEERKVTLQKVYRNTKNILRFIKKLGYQIEIPEKLKEGELVGEYILADEKEEIEMIQNIISTKTFSSLGILAKEEEYLNKFQKAFLGNEKIHVMTMSESQGVEFDEVVIVGVNDDMFAIDEKFCAELSQEKKRINRDLLYVALTRAISELHIMGKKKLEDVLG